MMANARPHHEVCPSAVPPLANKVLIDAEDKRRQTRSTIEDDLLTKYRNKAKARLTDLVNDPAMKLPLQCDADTVKFIWKAAGCKYGGEYYLNDWLSSHGYKLEIIWASSNGEDKIKNAFITYKHHICE